MLNCRESNMKLTENCDKFEVASCSFKLAAIKFNLSLNGNFYGKCESREDDLSDDTLGVGARDK